MLYSIIRESEKVLVLVVPSSCWNLVTKLLKNLWEGTLKRLFRVFLKHCQNCQTLHASLYITIRLPGGFESMNFDVISANIWLIYGIHKQIILPSRMWFVNPNKIANISMKTFSCMRPSKMVSISAMLSFILFIPLFYYWKEVLSDYYFIWTDDGSILMNITNLYNKQSSVEQLLLWAVNRNVLTMPEPLELRNMKHILNIFI